MAPDACGQTMPAAGSRPPKAFRVTYNFDPDRWYDDQVTLLEMRRAKGEVDEAAFNEALAALDARYQKMVARLDGTYEMPRKDGESGAQ